ncbi:SDR family NAD(P)-dependent oxidoreductase [Brevibacillus brevis]|uniref:SDR family NAD(P)-dependent oxidoreductase n=1 Tax=Brevibacillus brevis TaxID=1393 RepID=A0ABY9T061_BREBE|nr:SDR family NAD(P)-dependent oxidoreductase [Brevibacillus brevis]WNC13441.1 SDR family NAD(P)-dependent oxidoreductase [Brevibacillus brevis]
MTIFSNTAFRGKHALITGATGGIGSATAKLLASMGAAITLSGRNESRLESVSKEIRQQFPESTVHVIRADLTHQSERRKLVEGAVRQGGPISFLVNNAGAFQYEPMEELTQESMDSLIGINFTSTVLLTQLVYEGMKASGHGSIVTVSSLSGMRGLPGTISYSASKFALIGFTHALALEAIGHGIRVNAVCPGFVDTNMGHDVVSATAAAGNVSLEQRWQQVNASIPSGRITQPEEVANTIAFLLSDAAGNIVGEAVKISGGALVR